MNPNNNSSSASSSQFAKDTVNVRLQKKSAASSNINSGIKPNDQVVLKRDILGYPSQIATISSNVVISLDLQSSSSVAEYILQMFMQYFKEQSLKAIDDFAYQYKGGDNVTNIADYSQHVVFGNTTWNQVSSTSIGIASATSTIANLTAGSIAGGVAGGLGLNIPSLTSSTPSIASSLIAIGGASSSNALTNFAIGSGNNTMGNVGNSGGMNSNNSNANVSNGSGVGSGGSNSNAIVGNNSGGSSNVLNNSSSNPNNNNNMASGNHMVNNNLNNSNNVIASGINSSINTMGSGNNMGNVSLDVNSEYFIEERKLFDQLLSSFSTVSRHCVIPIVDALYAWRVNLDCKPPKSVREKVEDHVKLTYKKSLHGKQETDLINLYVERKELAADYVFCVAMLRVLNAFQQPELAPKLSENIENMCFQYFKRIPGVPSLQESRRKVLELFASIIGILSIKRFQPISDSFVSQITHPSTNKIEAVQLIRATKYLRLQLSRVDNVNRSLDFLKKIFDFFTKTKKSEIKVAICEALAHLLCPLAAYEYKSGIDYREWFDLLSKYYAQMVKYSKKQKTWSLCSYPCISTVLSSGPQKTFLENFWSHMETLFRLLQKEKTKLLGLDCILHVVGCYMKILTENKQEASSKQSQERMQKILSQLYQPGRKALPVATNDAIYDAMVDIVVMVANNKLEYGMNHGILEFLKNDTIFSENVYIGLRSFLTIADQCDVNNLNTVLEDDPKCLDKYPPWVIKLLERSNRLSSFDVGSEETDTYTSSSIRIPSPFSSYRSVNSSILSNTSMTFGVSTLKRIYSSSNVSVLATLGLNPYQDDLSKLLSHILQYCDNNFGQLLLTSNIRTITEVLPKDKIAGLKVFVTAISCIPRLIPNAYTPQQLMDLLCRCTFHQHKEVRDTAWEVMISIVEFQPHLNTILIQCLTDMVSTIDDFRKDLLISGLSKLILILSKWIESLDPSIEKMREKFKSPTVYGGFKNFVEYPLDLPNIEAVGLILLCNIEPAIRVRSLELFSLIRTLASSIVSRQNMTLNTTVADIIDELAIGIVDRLTKKVYTKRQYSDMTLEHFLLDKNSPPEFLRDLSKYISTFCPSTSKLALLKMSRKITKLNDRLSQQNEQDIEMWRNLIIYCCAIASDEDRNMSDNSRRKSKEIDTPRFLYELILTSLKSNQDKQLLAAVDAIGGVHEDMLEILFEQLKPYELDAFNKDNTKKVKKRKDHIRTQLSRIYSRISENIPNDLLREKEFVKEKFLSFIEEHVSYLTAPANIYSIDLQPIRYNLFTVIENIAKKIYYFPPLKGRTLDFKFRDNLIQFVIKWSGFGESNRKQELEEESNLAAVIEKCRDEEDKRKVDVIYRRRTETIRLKACSAIAALMLGPFIESDLLKLKQWSETTRMEEKSGTPLKDQGKAITKAIPSAKSTFPVLWGIATAKKDTEIHETPQTESSKGIMILKWIDEILCFVKEKLYVTIGITVIENMLEENPQLFSLCLDQCYHPNKSISQGYFEALVELFSRKSVNYNPGALVVLVLYFCASQRKETRNSAFRLLQLVSHTFFEENKESSNYPYMFSSNLIDNYDMVQNRLAYKIANDHPDLSYDVLDQVFKHLEFLHDTDQKSLLRIVIPFSANIKLKFTPPRSGVHDFNVVNKILNCMFDVTLTYGNKFAHQCKAMWQMLSADPNNVQNIIQYLVYRATSVEGIDFHTPQHQIFTICQKIMVYCAHRDPKCTIDTIVDELKSSRHDDDVGQHHRALTPTSDSRLPYIVRADVALILLADVAYNHYNHLKEKLPVVLQYLFMRMDHEVKLVSENAKLILCNLIHSFVINRLPHHGGTVQQIEHLESARRLVEYISQHKSKALWQRDRISLRALQTYSGQLFSTIPTTKNTQQLSYIVMRIVDVFKDEEDIRERWGAEALLWATRSHSIHNVIRSYQIYRTLIPTLKRDDVICILQDIRNYLEEMFAQHEDQSTKVVVTAEIIDTLRSLIKYMEPHRLILFPQLFWFCVAMLHADNIYLYIHSLHLLHEVINHLDISNESVQNVIKASLPKELKYSFQGIQRLVLRGILYPHSEAYSIELLCKFTLLPCGFIVDPNDKSRILMNIIGLLPWMCIHLTTPDIYAKCQNSAVNIAESCEEFKLKKIAKVFLRYSKGYYDSQEKFLLELRKPLSEFAFPQFENMIFDIFERFLEYGPMVYQKAVLAILHSLLLHVDMTRSTLGKRERLIVIVAGLLRTTAHQQATKVLDVIVRSSSKGLRDSVKVEFNNETQFSVLHAVMKNSSTRQLFYENKPGEGTKETISIIDKVIESVKGGPNEDSSNVLKYSGSLLSLFDNHPMFSTSIAEVELPPSISGDSQLQQSPNSVITKSTSYNRMLEKIQDVNLDFSTQDASEMDESEANDEETEFTEDYTEATEADAISTSFKTVGRSSVLEFEENEEEEESIKHFNGTISKKLESSKHRSAYLIVPHHAQSSTTSTVNSLHPQYGTIRSVLSNISNTSTSSNSSTSSGYHR